MKELRLLYLRSQNRTIHIGFGNSNAFSHKNRIHNSKSENSQKEDYVKMMYEHDALREKNPSLHIRSLHVKKN